MRIVVTGATGNLGTALLDVGLGLATACRVVRVRPGLVLQRGAGHELGAMFGGPLVRSTVRVMKKVPVRGAAAAAFHARASTLHPSWIDLIRRCPVLDTGRARELLGWAPTRDARSVFAEAVAGVRDDVRRETPRLD
jgi:hypothetical protein